MNELLKIINLNKQYNAAIWSNGLKYPTKNQTHTSPISGQYSSMQPTTPKALTFSEVDSILLSEFKSRKVFYQTQLDKLFSKMNQRIL